MNASTDRKFLLQLPDIPEEAKRWLHYNPNTSDVVDWIRDFARRAILGANVYRCAHCGFVAIGADEARAHFGDARAPIVTCLEDFGLELPVGEATELEPETIEAQDTRPAIHWDLGPDSP